MLNLNTARLMVALALSAAPLYASAVLYSYVDWISADPSGGTATGVITLPDSSTVDIGFNVFNADGSMGSFFFGQTSGGGTNYWNPDTPYISSEVDNAPPDTDILALIGGQDQTYEVTLSEAIKDPIMAIVSLGRTNLPTTYDFDRPFNIVSQEAGFWGGGPTALQSIAGDVLQGNEGHGTIQFIGTFDTFSWTVPTGENWHGFTYGIRTTLAIEPDPPTCDPTIQVCNVTIPEPTSLALMALGMAGIGYGRKRKAV